MYYAGVFCSLTWKEEIPLAKRIILEHLGDEVKFEDLSPELIPLFSSKYNKISKGIRRLLSGRIKNLIGFFREKGALFNAGNFKKEWSHSLNLGEVFFDYSRFCWGVEENPKDKIELALDMLGRAVLHGYEHIDLFIASVPPELVDTVTNHAKYRYIMRMLDKC